MEQSVKACDILSADQKDTVSVKITIQADLLADIKDFEATLDTVLRTIQEVTAQDSSIITFCMHMFG